MNLQQLEYIVAVDTHRHFANAAMHCFVTQPTLSMMIHKLEEELGVKIFERNKKPVVLTKEGEEIVNLAKRILLEVNRLKEYTATLKEEISGELRLGIIPTLAPYLLPLFLKSFTERYPNLRVVVKDLTTYEIINRLRLGELDMGLLATPLSEKGLVEYPLFYEEFYAYAALSEKLPPKKYVLPTHIDTHKLWLLEEGHCFRNQIYDLCELKKKDMASSNISYEAGSIETLINLVDKNEGITIVPKLATLNLKPQQLKKLREFSPPKPVREISLVVTETYPRRMIIEKLREEILNNIDFNTLDERRILAV
jgi:LysR family transcriptional regulator, hydrogen peroxide-inducible genes activator